jgi:hypothetical protein
MIQVNKLVCENSWIIEMHGAPIKVKKQTCVMLRLKLYGHKLSASKHLKLINCLRVFLSSTLDGNECFPGNEPPCPLNMKLVGPRAGWYVLNYGKISFLLPEIAQTWFNWSTNWSREMNIRAHWMRGWWVPVPGGTFWITVKSLFCCRKSLNLSPLFHPVKKLR